MFTESHFVIKKMSSFRNIQIRVDGALMFNATFYMYNPTCYELDVFLLFLPLFSLVVGYNFFLVIVYDFGTVISGVSCTLPNNWAKLFCTWGGEHLFEDGC